MKELSIEEKAKAYDEALEMAKKLIENEETNVPVFYVNNIKDIFPELKESEDERIKEDIITYLSTVEDKELIPYETWIAWLENQGKNNMGISEATKRKLVFNLNKALEKETPESWNEFLEKQGEQKHVNTVEPRFKINDKVIHKATGKIWTIHHYLKDTNSYYVEDNDGLLHHYIESELKLVEQKPAWSEEDEKYLSAASMYIYCTAHHGNIEKNEVIHWLKSLKDRVQLTKEWSEEELTQAKKDAFNDALDKIEYHSGEPTFDDGWSAAIDYIRKKSIRPQNWTKEDKERYISCLQRLSTGNPEQPETINSKWFKEHVYPQATWKPSDEQMVAIQEAINIVGVLTITGSKINSLYQDLKKLREG